MVMNLPSSFLCGSSYSTATAIAGKWQLGQFDQFPDQPVEHGFDRYCMWTWQYGGKKPRPKK